MMRTSCLPLLMVMLAGCERVVDLDLAEGPRRLVVEAKLERVLERSDSHQEITLTTTAAYFDTAAPPPARGAVVTVRDDAGRSWAFVESEPGSYGTVSLVPEKGREYTLDITWEGQRFRAVETAVGVSSIDSLYFEAPRPGRFSGTEGVRATINTSDPAGERNFYLWDQFVDGVRQLGPDSTFRMRLVAPDDAVDGRPVLGFQPFEGVDIPIGIEVVLRQSGLSEAMYRYFFAMSDQVSGDGSIFSVPASSVRGNVANLTSPAQRPVGYFMVGEVSEARATRR